LASSRTAIVKKHLKVSRSIEYVIEVAGINNQKTVRGQLYENNEFISIRFK
jgi:hypothetical protein